MGHASDCAVNDGPAFLPGPCDCGLEFDIDADELFRPLLVVGARRGRWDIRHRNVEAFVEAEETPIGDGRRVSVTIYLPDAHGWPTFASESDGVDLNDTGMVVIMKAKANAVLQSLKGFLTILFSFSRVLARKRFNRLRGTGG